MRNVIKHKSNCKFCEEATIRSPDGKKVIAHYKCAINSESRACQGGWRKRGGEMMPKYAKALLGAYAKKMRDVIHEVQANEKDEIVVHKLAEIAADCALCERKYGEVDDAHT